MSVGRLVAIRPRPWAAAGLWWLLALLALSLPGSSRAGTTGKLYGRVVDTEGKPIEVAAVSLEGTRLSAYTDADGRYTILNIPAGTYLVSFRRLGYGGQKVQNVVVSADQAGALDATLIGSAVTAEEIVVTAERPPVELSGTSTSATLTAEQIESLPVQSLQDVVNLQAGVVDGHFRGGRSGEVQYQVDGVSVNNPYDNSPMLNLDRSLLQEVQVISGTFDAEYGQAMSGVVNAVLKQGTPDFRWNAEVYGGGFFFPDGADRGASLTLHPAGTQSYQMSLSGPVPLPDTVFLISGRRFVFDDWVYGERRFVPTDRGDFQNNVYGGTGDHAQVPLGYSREWSGVIKLTNSHFKNSKLNYQATFSRVAGRAASFDFRYNPDGMTHQRTWTISHGLDWTQTLGEQTFLNFSARQNFLDYKRLVFDDLYDPGYDQAGPALGSRSYEHGAIIQGVDLGREIRRTNALVVKSSVTGQWARDHLIKFGGELELPSVKFGAPGWAVRGGGDQLVARYQDDPPFHPAARVYYPMMGAAYVQDQIDRKDLTVRLGLRFDYMNSRSMLPSDLANPANAIPDAPPSPLRPTTPKYSVSPRLGIAFPIEDKAAVHFAYGHFRQFPSIVDMFSNADYSPLFSLQAGAPLDKTYGNPDVRPEKTVQYEIGYKHAITPDFGVDLTVFYKDIRDLIGVEIIDTYNDAQYARLTNVDFGDVLGVTLALDHRKLGPVSLSLDYTWQQALGNSSDPEETRVRLAAQADPRPRLIPFNWDQRHTLNLTAALEEPGRYAVSAVLKVASGQPYTPALDPAYGFGMVDNSGRKPTGMVVDLRAERDLPAVARNLVVFARVLNVFDTRYFNGYVFSTTGSPYYSRFPEPDWSGLHDAGRFYPPRRIELGGRFDLGGS